MKFEWDEKKEKANIKSHGIDFRTAIHVFLDDNRIEYFDEKHSVNEDRYITIGMVGEVMLVMLVYTERNGRIRVISARPANKRERSAYYGNL